MTKNIAFQTILDALLDYSKPFPPRFLYLFSDIEPGNLKLLLKTWPQVSLTRQRILLEDLKELAEDNTLLCFDDLARALLKDADPQVRVLALHLLWECGDTRLVPTFIEILNKDSDFNVRAAAATALGMFVYLGEFEEIPPHIQRKVEDNLLAVLRSSDQILVRRRALEALGSSSRPEVTGLIEAAYDGEEADWKVSALFAMGRSGDEGWGKQVLSNLRNQNEAIRMEAIHAAGDLGLASARPVLLDMLADASIPTALFALGVSLAAYSLKGAWSGMLALIALKMLLMPVLVFILVRYVVTIPPIWAQVAVLFAAMPTGAKAFLFAQRNEEAAAAVSGEESATSLVTLPGMRWSTSLAFT